MSDDLKIPAFGAPCNGCGWCCREQLCGLAIEIIGEGIGPCPFLVERAGRTWCGVVEEAAKQNVAFGAHLAWRLGIGVGCQVDEDARS